MGGRFARRQASAGGCACSSVRCSIRPRRSPSIPCAACPIDRSIFDALQDAAAPRVYTGATHVRTGRAAVFSGAALTLDAVLASTGLPQTFPPVRIRGEIYWDGGYSGNPPLAPFLREPSGGDVLLVQIRRRWQPV